MWRVLIVVTFCVALCDGRVDDSNRFSDNLQTNNRQKRLLLCKNGSLLTIKSRRGPTSFELVWSSLNSSLNIYDEDGNLVKTYSRPHLYDFTEKPSHYPFFGKFFNPFLAFLQPSTFGAMPYMIPVSEAVIQQIDRDPIFQNKIMLLPAGTRDPQISIDPSCAGKRTQIPSTKSCGSFLNCWDGLAFEQECPEGLLFSIEGYCDYSDNVNCNERRAVPEEPQQAKCSKDFEAFRNELNCREFFVCVNRLPVKFKCPADLAYSQAFGVCDYPYRVDCNSSVAINTEAPAASQPASEAAPEPSASSTVAPPAPAAPQTVTMTKSTFNSQSLSTTHVAISRQDAIRQLKLSDIADVTSA